MLNTKSSVVNREAGALIGDRGVERMFEDQCNSLLCNCTLDLLYQCNDTLFPVNYYEVIDSNIVAGDLILLSLIILISVVVVLWIICCVYMLIRCRSRSGKYRVKSERNSDQELENDLINQENSSDVLRETDLTGSTDKLNVDNRVYSSNNIASGPPPAPPPPQLMGAGITEDDAMYDQVVTVTAGKTKPVPTFAPVIPPAEYQNTKPGANKTTEPASQPAAPPPPPPPPPENSALVYAMVDKSKKKSNNQAAKPSTPVRINPPGPTQILYDDVVTSDAYNVLQHNRFEKSPTKKAVKGGNTQQLDDPSFYDTIINQDYSKATPPFTNLPNNYDVVNL